MKTPFQFSIREIFLLTMAIGAILALARTYWKQAQQLQGTELVNQFSIPSDVERFAKEHGLTGYISYSGSGGGGSDFTRSRRSGKYSFDLPVECHDEIVLKLCQSIEDKITEGGCRVYGRGAGSSGREWKYSGDSLDGTAELLTMSQTGKESKLHILFLVIEDSRHTR